MAPKIPKFRRVKIEIPPFPSKKWKSPFKPHVATPFKRKPIRRKPIYPHMAKGPHYTLDKIWHKYRIFGKNSAILYGRFAQSDLRFPIKVRGRLGPSSCFVAIGFTKVREMEKWDVNSISAILAVGLKLYLQSVAINKNTCDCTSPKEVHNTFYLEGNQLVLSVDDDMLKGALIPDEGQPDFKDELKKVFLNTNYCILEVEGKFMSIWKLNKSYYLFDPNDRDVTGENRVHEGYGIAIVLKFIQFGHLVKHIRNILSPTGDKKAFTIFLIFIKKFIKANLLPPASLAEVSLPSKPPAKVPPKSCLASKMPSKVDLNVPIGPIPQSPEITAAASPKKPKKIKEVEIAVVDNSTNSNTPSFSDLLDPDRLIYKPNLIPSEKPKAPAVTYYQWAIPGKLSILIGSCHQNSGKCTKFEGKQALGNAIAAIGMLRIYKSKLWYPKIIDEMLLTGETIYIQSRNNFMGDQELNVHNVVSTFSINNRYFKHNIEENTGIGQLNSAAPNIADLLPVLLEFFSENDAGIIRGPILMAIWHEEGKFYMFDPNERDTQGKVIDKQLSVDWPDTVVSEPGFACVTWSPNLNVLVNLYVSNLCREAKTSFFYMSKIEVEDYVELPEPWNFFIPLNPGKWILRGTYSQNNTCFTKFSRNNQGTCMAVMAVIISQFTKCSDWDRATVDEILMEGESFYNMSVEALKAKNMFQDKRLMLCEVFRKYNYQKKQMNLIIEDCLINGALNMKEKVNSIPDLRSGFEEFFQLYDRGVLTSRGQSFGFWKFENSYFYFDSHSRNDMGYVYDGGLACILRFETLSEMLKVMFANLKPIGVDFYNIGRINMTIYEITEEGTVKPPFFDYLELSPKKGIVRASLHQGDIDKYDVRADKQTVPNLLTALAMTSVLPCNQWNTTTLDQILAIGDKLYEDTRVEIVHTDLEDSANWETQEKPIDLYMVNTENVIKKIKIGVNVIRYEIQEAKQGIFEPERVKRDKSGAVIYQKFELQNMLWNALENKDVPKGSKHEILLDSDHITLAIWTDQDLYYVFDPKGKDYEGNFFGRDLWSAKIVILDEDYEMAEDFLYTGQRVTNSQILKDIENPETRKVDVEFEVGDEEDEEEEEEIISLKIDISDAKACVIMFTTFDDLYRHIMENVRPNKRTDHFKIYPVVLTSTLGMKVVTNPQNRTEGNWYSFEEIEKYTWILRGTMDLRNSTFPEINRGKQYASMCISACVYSRLYALPKFTSSTIDYILKYGDKLHTAVRRSRANELKKNKAQVGLTDEEINFIIGGLEIRATENLKEFLIGDYHVVLEFQQDVVEGDITAREKKPPPPPPPPPVAEVKDPKELKSTGSGLLKPKKSRLRLGSIRSKSSIASSVLEAQGALDAGTPSQAALTVRVEPVEISLRKGIRKFFGSYQFGILNVKGISLAFWKINDYFYLFDPESRGPSGLKVWNGTAYIMRFGDRRTMTDLIEKNLSKDGSNVYRIDALTIKSKLAYRPAASIPAVLPMNPKMTAFREITRDKHILRGSFHQDNPKFNLSTNATGACNAIVALTMAQIHPAETWSKPIVDDIIMNSFRLYKQSVISRGYDFNEWEDTMILEKIDREFKIGVINANWKITNEGVVKGILSIKSPDIPNLRKCCEDFFLDYNIGVIQSAPLTVGIWLDREIFYMFDPNPRGPSGLYSTGGTACLLVFSNMRDMLNHYLSNIPPRLYNQDFTICPVEISTSESKPKKIPPMRKSDILKVKEIDSLSGYLNENEKYTCVDATTKQLKNKEKQFILNFEKETGKMGSKKRSKKAAKQPQFTCDKTKKSKKHDIRSRKEKSTKDPCCCPDKSRLIPRKKLVVDESKFSPEDKKMWARGKSEAKKLKELQAKEHRLRAEFYVLENGDAIVRAHYSQNADKFSFLSRNKQAQANALVAIVMSKLHEPKTWSYKNIEIILESGDVLYKDSYMKYRPTNLLLGLKNLMRKFYIFHLKISTVIYKPYIFGDCRYEDLYVGLLNFFMQETAGILVSNKESFALAVFQKAGKYYMFDPHDRNVRGEATDEKGCACLMRFNTIENLVDKYMKNADIDLESESVPRFSVCAVTLESVERITKDV